jgi:undecaprenyl diphosphate synthase
VPDEITEKCISEHLTTQKIPDPELIIRTSGEFRVSNFLLWQIAYSEFVILDVYWPDFSRKHLYDAIRQYQTRERRFGKVSEQLLNNETSKQMKKDHPVEV